MIETLGQFNMAILSEDTDTKTLSITKRINTFLRNRPAKEFHRRIRASDMGDPCIRKYVLNFLDPIVKDPPAPADLQRLFDQGNITHKWWQNNYYGKIGMLRGIWKCPICKREVKGYMPKKPCGTEIVIRDLEDLKTSCEGLGMEWQYGEIWVEYKAHGLLLVGKCDGILYLGQSQPDTVLEIKTEDSERWKLRKRPEPKDITQASIYADCLGLKKILPSYVNKSTWKTKDFLMDADPRARVWLDGQMKIIADLIAERKPKSAPRRCDTATCSRAERCGFKNTCF